MPAPASVLSRARQGWYFFPVRAGQKKPPLVSDWESAATTDPEKLNAWEQQFPGCNWAVACGKSHFVVVDVDNKAAKRGRATLDALELEHGDLPATLAVSTPSGGTHIYLHGLAQSSVERLGSGLDIRSSGGYVIAPGSAVDGVPYGVTSDVPVQQAPDWLLALAGKPVERAKTAPVCDLDTEANLDQASRYLESAAPAIQGEGGDARTFAVACAVKDCGVSEEKALELMLEHWNDRCDPPWEPEQLEIKVANAYSYGKEPAGAKSVEAAFADIPVEEPEAAPAPKASLFCAAAIVPEKIPPRRWLLGYRFLRGYLTVTIAPGGVGKSTLSILEALALASGKELTGAKVHEKVATWVYNTEDPMDELARRVVAAQRSHGLPESALANVYLSSGRTNPLVLVTDAGKGPLVNKKQLDDTIEKIKFHNIGLLVLDPFVRLHRVNENDNMAIDLVALCLSKIAAETGCAVHVIHHTRKRAQGAGGEGDMDSGRGASSLMSAARIAHTLCGVNEKTWEAMGQVESERKKWVRLDDAKANLAPPSDKVEWYKRESYPVNQDSVGVLRRAELPERVKDAGANTKEKGPG